MMQTRGFAMRSPISPKTSLEYQIYYSKTVKDLFTIVLAPPPEDDEILPWRSVYFFFRGLKHIQHHNGAGKVYY